jgi:hypothetical protein
MQSEFSKTPFKNGDRIKCRVKSSDYYNEEGTVISEGYIKYNPDKIMRDLVWRVKLDNAPFISIYKECDMELSTQYKREKILNELGI